MEFRVDALIGYRIKVPVDPELIPQSRLSFSGTAQTRTGKICRDPKAKRALCKALRDSFYWRDADEVYLVADWRDDSYFTTSGLNGVTIDCRNSEICAMSIAFLQDGRCVPQVLSGLCSGEHEPGNRCQ